MKNIITLQLLLLLTWGTSIFTEQTEQGINTPATEQASQDVSVIKNTESEINKNILNITREINSIVGNKNIAQYQENEPAINTKNQAAFSRIQNYINSIRDKVKSLTKNITLSAGINAIKDKLSKETDDRNKKILEFKLELAYKDVEMIEQSINNLDGTINLLLSNAKWLGDPLNIDYKNTFEYLSILLQDFELRIDLFISTMLHTQEGYLT